ncbi:MAG: hypothetical protein GF384_03345 [Elusimicrobia bacterium]|nr:hypothetical protein [Elusimicrobiota bacterium]MBD3411953.1 hypothetical protein [Elusimicrobiota bacterium]
MKKFRFSPSALSLMNDCPRCFWLEKNKGVKRPRGIFPSLPGGMDLVIKTYLDTYREKNIMPPEITDILPGKLFPDTKTLNKWRSWRLTDLVYHDPDNGSVLSGALDDCLVDNDIYIPLDYKTRGSALIDDPAKYYQIQLDAYTLMLESKGFKTNNTAYLLYFWPELVKENGMIRFAVTPYKINTNSNTTKQLIKTAVDCLNNNMPAASPRCEYCGFVNQRKDQPQPVKTSPAPPSKSPDKKYDEENGQYYFF